MHGFDEKAYQAFLEAATEKYDFASSKCPSGFREKGSATVNGMRTKICCTPDGKYCQTEWGQEYKP